MGYFLGILAILIIGGFFALLLRHATSQPKDYDVETVDIIEAGSVLNQQAHGRERWRRVQVEMLDRPLCFEEELNLRRIKDG